jgi:hypothetical protein
MNFPERFPQPPMSFRFYVYQQAEEWKSQLTLTVAVVMEPRWDEDYGCWSVPIGTKFFLN